MVKKRTPGQSYPVGFTQNQILLVLCEKDKTSTSEIVDHLKEALGIREQKNIREHHLKKLEKDKLIKRESAGTGHSDYWYVPQTPTVFRKLLYRFATADLDIKFLSTHYADNMFINNNSCVGAVAVFISDRKRIHIEKINDLATQHAAMQKHLSQPAAFNEKYVFEDVVESLRMVLYPSCKQPDKISSALCSADMVYELWMAYYTHEIAPYQRVIDDAQTPATLDKAVKDKEDMAANIVKKLLGNQTPNTEITDAERAWWEFITDARAAAGIVDTTTRTPAQPSDTLL